MIKHMLNVGYVFQINHCFNIYNHLTWIIRQDFGAFVYVCWGGGLVLVVLIKCRTIQRSSRVWSA